MPPELALDTSGGSASSGNSPVMRLTLSRTSLAASSMSRSMLNSRLTVDLPSSLLDSMVLSPSTPDTQSSTIWVILVSTTLADAPV